MKSKAYFALNSWLQKADDHYVSGRLLWLHGLIDGACNLLWLSIELMIKILILQNVINQIETSSDDLKEIHKMLDEKAKEISKHHKKKDLVKELDKNYPLINISNYNTILGKLEEFYFRRYVVHKNTSIELAMLDSVDKLFFLLRDNVSPDVGRGIIDEIHMERVLNLSHPIQAYSVSYLNNNYFRPRISQSYSFADVSTLKSYSTRDGISYSEGESLPPSFEKWLRKTYPSSVFKK